MTTYHGLKRILPKIKKGYTCLECGHQLYHSSFLDDQTVCGVCGERYPIVDGKLVMEM